ncbi:Hsp70 family protein [Paraburkholderia sp. Ac-20336]|uniref:Hsp70 family protein n=1 Tax=Paraburkholderia sp. Ac-20336 TaxID=2703886 RepID=UPI0019815541|nr:Hsp70 family protein [Paraburkholderia sp. Ac-20336]MBN3801956.1 Hsp70 family protein [Paraburkholderia sp. Ac-20336]
MSNAINFGIDLGTCNSLIAKFDKGQVEVFKNPSGFKETLPSVVGFRNNRILVGEQAKTYVQRDAKSVASRFKRKMGTTESLPIKALNASKTPVELSAYVLKELKTFVHTGEELDSAVVTIPASFDTLQSNATREAGLLAGFKNVVLLQEPIAASLAYANKEKNVDLRNSQWLVYDLGGGTFDAALVRIIEGELTVMDHEGDNYLGGTDFDALLVEKIVVPELNRRGKFDNLLAEMKSQSGRYNQLWYVLLNLAEDAKVELSAKTSAEIDLGAINVEDDDGNAIDTLITVTRSDFEAIIKDLVDSTIEMVRRILTRNSLQPSDLKFVLMVGGSTYIPYVRKRVEEVLGIGVNTSIDPTNAIAVGAAYFAGTKQKEVMQAKQPGSLASSLRIRTAYNKTSQEREESFMARVEGDTDGMHYRIVSDDGAFDSGLKALGTRILEDLPLREGAYNIFAFKVFDSQGAAVPTDVEAIQIAQGRYSIAGQMLPDDLCLVIDDLVAKDTRLETLFSKNVVLPAQTRLTKEVARTVVKGSDDGLRIIVVEGPSERHSSTNKALGTLVITGKELTRDLHKGTEVDLKISMSESRDITVHAYLTATDQEFSQIFKSQNRNVQTSVLAAETLMLETKIQAEIEDASVNGQRDAAAQLGKVLAGVQSLMGQVAALTDDDVTDSKFQLDDRKRKLAQELHELTSGKRIELARKEYQDAKSECGQLVSESGNDRERSRFKEIVGREPGFINSSNVEKIQAETAHLLSIQYSILMRTPDFLKGLFSHLNDKRHSMNDQIQATQLAESGKRAIEREDWDNLRQIVGRLWDLLPAEVQAEEGRMFTGLV